MNTHEMLTALSQLPKDKPILVRYKAGRAPSERAIREAERALSDGYKAYEYVGKLHSVWKNRHGEIVMTLVCQNRDNEQTGETEAFRTFNPNLGTLFSIRPLEI